MKRRSEAASAAARIVLAGPGRGDLRERASRFLSFANPIASAEEAAGFLEELQRRYHDATHIAYAWKLGTGASAKARFSDAGEPRGTAGKPIAAAIDSAGVTDLVVAVVRYFGGTKLGTAGLVRAYREAASRAVASAGAKTRREARSVLVHCPYERLGSLSRLLRPPDVIRGSEEYGATPSIRLSVSVSHLPALLAALEENRFEYEMEPGAD